MRVDGAYLTGVLQSLVRIDSVNPTLVPGGAGEAHIAEYVAQTMRFLGLDAIPVEHAPGRVSVVGRLSGSGGGRSLMFNAHHDTVGVEGMSDPFGAVRRDGRIYGRGAYDMKGSLAAMLTAAKAITDSGTRLRGDLLVAAVADEEYGSIGTAGIIPRFKTDAAIVTEPSALNICLAHKGYMWIAVETEGRAAHGSKFDLGIDANMRMGRFIARLDSLERDLRNRPPHPLVGPPSLHAATLHGGAGLSTYSPKCRLEIERRTIPGETAAQALGEIQNIVDDLGREDPTFRATVESFFVRDPFEVPRDAGIVQTVDRAVSSTLGQTARYVGDTPWMDAALLSAAGVETVVIGPAGTGAHAIEEWVDIESCVHLAGILSRAAAEWCQ